MRGALTYTPDVSASSSILTLDAPQTTPNAWVPSQKTNVSPEFLLQIEASPFPPTNDISVKPVMDLYGTEFHETLENFYLFWDSLNNPSYIWPKGFQKHDKKMYEDGLLYAPEALTRRGFSTHHCLMGHCGVARFFPRIKVTIQNF